MVKLDYFNPKYSCKCISNRVLLLEKACMCVCLTDYSDSQVKNKADTGDGYLDFSNSTLILHSHNTHKYTHLSAHRKT